MLALSQVILGVRDLELASARLEESGLSVIDGGIHPGVGTANRIVPLGSSYLELLGVDAAMASQSVYGRSLMARLEAAQGADTLVRWSLRTDDIDGVAARLSLPVERRRRVRPDGVEITWRAAGLDLALDSPWLPFFMAWDDPAQYPGLPPNGHLHPAAPVSITCLELSAGSDPRLPLWLQGAEAPVKLEPGPPGLLGVTLSTARGHLRIS